MSSVTGNRGGIGKKVASGRIHLLKRGAAPDNRRQRRVPRKNASNIPSAGGSAMLLPPPPSLVSGAQPGQFEPPGGVRFYPGRAIDDIEGTAMNGSKLKRLALAALATLATGPAALGDDVPFA